MTDLSPAELTAKVARALDSERSVEEVAQTVGVDRSKALDVMLFMAGRGQIELADSLHKKWILKRRARE